MSGTMNDGYPLAFNNEEAPDLVEELSTKLNRIEQSLMAQMRDMRRSLEHNLEVAEGQITKQKQSLEVANAKLRVVEQRTIRQTSEIKFLNHLVEKHGLAEELPPLRQELLDLSKREDKTSDHVEELHETLHSNLARVEEELKKLDAGAKESARLESMSISYQVDDLRRDYGHFSSWARPLLEEFLPLPAEVRDFHRDVEDLRTRQDRCEDDVNKIQRLGRILDDKVEVFDDLQRRMEELNANARRVLGSQFATSVRCLCCKDDEALALVSRQRSTSPPRMAPAVVVNNQFETEAAAPKRRRPQSATARLEQKRSEEKPKSAENQKHQMVFTVPRVRTDFKQGPVVGIRGVSIFKPGKAPQSSAAPRRRPQSARACLQSSPQTDMDPSPPSP